jgi:KUP system potassium uptake protein
MAQTQAAAPGHADSAAPAAGTAYPEQQATQPGEHADGHHKASFWTLAVGSVGVVYGDIGTSPLYAFRESVKAAAAGGPVTNEIVVGVLSLILWALTLVVTIKYIVILLRADNNGEGGTLTLVALAQRAMGRRGHLILLLGAAGAGLFYGDAIITPAISVLSAVEGLTSRPRRSSLSSFRPRSRSWCCSSPCRARARLRSRRSSGR